jgi:hypothetical protein
MDVVVVMKPVYLRRRETMSANTAEAAPRWGLKLGVAWSCLLGLEGRVVEIRYL